MFNAATEALCDNNFERSFLLTYTFMLEDIYLVSYRLRVKMLLKKIHPPLTLLLLLRLQASVFPLAGELC